MKKKIVDLIKLVYYTSFMEREQNSIVGSFEAKTHLSQLLEQVEQGVEITITRRGKPIARLVPYEADEKHKDRNELLDTFGEIRKVVKKPVDIKEYIREGRKY